MTKRISAKRKPGRPKTGEPSAVKPTVLRTASALFMELGYDSVSLEQIADAAGVTKASVYYYFSNKAELFTESIALMLSHIASLTKGMLESPGTLRERLTNVAAGHMRIPRVDFESLLREAGPALTYSQLSAIRDAERAAHDVLAAAFREEMELGALRKGDPLLYAYAFSALMMLGGRIRPIGGESSGRPASFAELSPADVVDLFWSGVGRMV